MCFDVLLMNMQELILGTLRCHFAVSFGVFFGVACGVALMLLPFPQCRFIVA